MSDTKFSALSALGVPQTTDILAIVRAGTGPFQSTIANLHGTPGAIGNVTPSSVDATGLALIAASQPFIKWNDTGAPANSKRARIVWAGSTAVGGTGGWVFQDYSDADGFVANRITIYKDGAVHFGGITYPGAANAINIGGTLQVGAAATFLSTLSFGGRADLKSYTVGTLPAAGAAGGIVYCSNAGGNGPCIAMSNGTVWKRCDNVSTTVV